jgi:hypothetical protein
VCGSMEVMKGCINTGPCFVFLTNPPYHLGVSRQPVNLVDGRLV